MKKKILAILLTLTVGFTMVTGCSGATSKDDSGGDKAKTETESIDDVTTEEDAVKEDDAAKPNDRESERLSYFYDFAGVTEEEMNSLYECISSSISENYLKLYDIDSSEFSIPEDIYDSAYLRRLSSEYTSTTVELRDVIKNVEDDTVLTAGMSSDSIEIANAIFIGIVDWYNEDASAQRSDFYEAVGNLISILNSVPLEENLTFNK